MFIWHKLFGDLFLLTCLLLMKAGAKHDINETYKAYKETFLIEGLRRYVCNNIKTIAGLPFRRAF